MASVSRRHLPKCHVYYWDPKDGKQVWIPRPQTRHLDDQPYAEMQAWAEQWEKDSGIARVRSKKRSLLTDDQLSRLVDLHLQEHAALRAPGEGTLAEYRYHFAHYILPYFVETHASKNPATWHSFTPNMAVWLRTEHELSMGVVRKVCQTLGRFGKWLVGQRLLAQPWFIPLPREKGKRKTPLSKKVTPEQALEYATALDPEPALAVLLQYFGSLAPEEAYALEREDLLTGDEARKRASTFKRFEKFKLGSGLSVVICKTLVRTGLEPHTKNDYRTAIVNIWHSAGAKAIATLVKGMPEGRLFPGTRHQVDRRYRDSVRVQTELNAQDWRRASANHLGKVVGVDVFLLKDHLRHSEIETTLLYTRDPVTDAETAGEQDFDDVG